MTEKRYRAGQALYFATVDAQGYPNGMAPWAYLSPLDKYHWCCVASQAMAHASKMFEITRELDLNGAYENGDCEMLAEYIRSAHPAEVERMEKWDEEWSRNPTPAIRRATDEEVAALKPDESGT